MDYSVGETFDIKFTTRQFSDGVPTTAASLAVSAYPGNSTTQLTAGITTTFTSGFDGVAGLVNVRVVATTGNGYAAGTTYYLVATAGTVGGVSIVGEVVGEFTLGRSAAATRLGLLTATASTGNPGTTVGVIAYLKQLINVLIGTAGVTTFPAEAAPANAVSLAEVIRAIHTDVTGLNGAAMRGTDSAGTAAELAKVPKSDSTVSWNATALAAINAEADTALSDYDPPTKAELDAGIANVSVDEIQATALADLFNTDSGTTYGSAISGSVVAEIADNAGGSALTEGGIADAVWDELLAGHTTTDSAGELLNDWQNGGRLDVILDARASQSTADAIETDTQDLQTQIGTAGAGLTDLGGMSTGMKAEVNAEADTAISDYDPPTNAEMEARTLVAAAYFDPAADTVATVTDVSNLHASAATAAALATAQADLDIITGGSGVVIASGTITDASFDTTAGAFSALGVIDQGTAQSATSTTLVLRSAAAFANDELIGAVIVITGGSAGVGQSRTITDYVGSSDTATVDTWTTTPSGTITYKIFAAPPAPTTLPVVNATQISGSASAADNLEASALAIVPFTVSGTPTTTSMNTNITGYADNFLVGREVLFASGTAIGQRATILTYTSTNGVVTYAALDTASVSGDTGVIV